MKKILPILFIVIGAILLSINQPVYQTGAATVTTGVTFTTNQLVQYYDLNNAVNNATVSDIVSGDITDGTIAAADLGANSVTSAKILNSTIVSADILPRGLTGGEIATNGITEIELSTNITTRAGNWDLTQTRFTADSITNVAVLGTTTGGAAGDSGKIVKLDSTGKVDPSMLPFNSVLTTNRSSATSGAANNWTAIGSLTTTITNGGVVVTGRAVPPVGGTSIYYVRVRASDHSISSQAVITGAADSTARALSVSLVDSLTTTSTKQYILEISDGNGSQTWTANATGGVGGTDNVTNHMGMTILQYGK